MSASRLAQLTPVIRGLLATPSGSEDMPHCHVIVGSLTGRDAVDFASSPEEAEAGKWPAPLKKSDRPPLYVQSLPEEADPQELRAPLAEAIESYATEHDCKPRVVCLLDLGVLHVADTPADKKLSLHNKVALVTGAAGAIGYGICQGLLNNGCHVAATDLPGERFDAFVRELKRGAGTRVIGVAMDVTNQASVASGFEEVTRQWGGVDIVVVNAGTALVCKLVEMDLEAFRKLEKVNVEGTLLTLAEAGRHLTLQGTGGDIIVISTKNVPCPGAGFGAYSSTKAAGHQLGRIASLELAEFDIRVNMVSPDAVFGEGKFKSGLWAEVGPSRMRARGLDEKGLQEYYRNRNLLKARVTARHVANAVLFFATRQTPTTGATIPVDGGLPDATPR